MRCRAPGPAPARQERPPAADDVAPPAQDRAGSDDQPHRRQALRRYRSCKQRQPRPVRPRQTRVSARPLALSHSELMAQHKDLGVLPPPLPPRQAQQRHGMGRNQEDQLQAHKPKIIPRPGRQRPAGHVPDAWPSSQRSAEHPARWHRFSAPTGYPGSRRRAARRAGLGDEAVAMAADRSDGAGPDRSLVAGTPRARRYPPRAERRDPGQLPDPSGMSARRSSSSAKEPVALPSSTLAAIDLPTPAIRCSATPISAVTSCGWAAMARAALLETRARNGSPPVRTIRSAYSSCRRDGVNGLGHDSILPRLTG